MGVVDRSSNAKNLSGPPMQSTTSAASCSIKVIQADALAPGLYHVYPDLVEQ